MFGVLMSLFCIVIHHISFNNLYELIYEFFTAVTADIQEDSQVGINTHVEIQAGNRKINHQLYVLYIFQKRHL